MFGSSMLDIAIGITFIFLLLSVFATAINEIILSSLNMRGKDLLRGIQAMLDEKNNNGLVAKVYNNGQVYGLFKGDFDPKKRHELPSYIPSRNFAIAVLDVVHQQGAAWIAANAANAPAQQPPLVPQQAPNPAAPAAPTAVNTIIAITQEVKAGAAALAANPLTDKLGKPLISMIAMAGNDANKLQKAVEDWYNSAMDRVSGWYKYRTQRVLFVIGLVMAILLNANTIGIVRQISKDPTLRQSIVAAAQNVKPLQPTASLGMKAQMDSASQSFDDVTALGIPLGWPYGAPRLAAIWRSPFTWNPWSALLYNRSSWETLLGWILTAIAVSLGAPFWFDALNKIMVVRSTVKPTEKSKDEGSKS